MRPRWAYRALRLSPCAEYSCSASVNIGAASAQLYKSPRWRACLRSTSGSSLDVCARADANSAAHKKAEIRIVLRFMAFVPHYWTVQVERKPVEQDGCPHGSRLPGCNRQLGLG